MVADLSLREAMLKEVPGKVLALPYQVQGGCKDADVAALTIPKPLRTLATQTIRMHLSLKAILILLSGDSAIVTLTQVNKVTE